MQLERLIEALNKIGFKVESVKELSTGIKNVKGYYKENIPFDIRISEILPGHQKMNSIICIIKEESEIKDIEIKLNVEKDSKYFEESEWIEELIKLIDYEMKKIQNDL